MSGPAKSTPALRLRVIRSRIELIGLVLLHLMASVMPWLAQLPWWVRAALSLGVVASAVLEWRRWSRVLPLDIRLLPDGRWGVGASSFDEIEATLQPGAFRSTFLIVLPLLLADGGKRRVVLWPDSASADDLRRLRAWLRWGATFGADTKEGEEADAV
jgi:hypothetical protein